MDLSVKDIIRTLSIASLALEINSRKKMSRVLYKELTIISIKRLTSAWNSCSCPSELIAACCSSVKLCMSECVLRVMLLCEDRDSDVLNTGTIPSTFSDSSALIAYSDSAKDRINVLRSMVDYLDALKLSSLTFEKNNFLTIAYTVPPEG